MIVLWAVLAAAGCDAVPEGMACVPAGPFVRGADDGDADERPRAQVELDAFFIDLHEVTYAEYQACVAAKACTRAGPNYKGFSGERQPMLGLNWFQAQAFCTWRGKRWPTEAEWEKAARGLDGRIFPWGDEPATCARAVIEEDGKKGCGLGKPPKGATADVGTRAAGAHGLFDMAGNSWEWVSDWYSKSYAACGAACEGKNPKGPCAGAARCPGFTEKIVRGGSWFWPAREARASNRRAHTPENRPFHHFGFRCAQTPRSP